MTSELFTKATELKCKLYAEPLTSGVIHVDPLVKCTSQQYIRLTGQAEDSGPSPDQAPLCATCLQVPQPHCAVEAP